MALYAAHVHRGGDGCWNHHDGKYDGLDGKGRRHGRRGLACAAVSVLEARKMSVWTEEDVIMWKFSINRLHAQSEQT